MVWKLEGLKIPEDFEGDGMWFLDGING